MVCKCCERCDGLGFVDEDREYGDGIMAALWTCHECGGSGIDE